MKTHIITTGGTIAGLDYEEKRDGTGNIPIPLRAFLETANVSFEYTIDNVFNKDSRYITTTDRDLIATKIGNSTEEKILVTHGTYTMPETADYLSRLKFDKTIVLTGAFILGTDKNTDAPFNLGYAIAALQFLDNGVYIAMNGRLFSPENVIKNLEKNRFEEK